MGIQAAIELSQKLKIEKVTGTIIIVKVMNRPAFEHRNGSMGLTDWGATFAAITVTVLPVFIFYFFSSKKMLAGMTAGAVKG